MRDFGAWIGNTQAIEDVLTPAIVAGFHAVLDHERAPPQAGDTAPFGCHWALCVPRARQSLLGPDGHPQRGGFLPPVELPKRMWAGSQTRFHEPLRVGDVVTRTSAIASIEHKQGRSGPLVFVNVEHEYSKGATACISERQVIVFRDGESSSGANAPQVPDLDWSWRDSRRPDAVMLFRYSALTFNGHRIHYDADYVRDIEGYPGLVVHGPLTATLLLDLCARHLNGRRLLSFEFRARMPTFAGEEIKLLAAANAEEATLFAANAENRVITQATATFSS